MGKLISIIVPMYNERDNVERFFHRIAPVIATIRERWNYRVEVIVNENRSTDKTFDALRDYAQSRNRDDFDLRIFRFARNVGFQRSIMAGYMQSRGDAVVQIDADLQDPPELIATFIEKWLEGNLVVYGVRRRRNDGFIRTWIRKLFYRLIDRISGDDLPHDAGDFRLIDRKLVRVICAIGDHDPYIRGLVASLGTRQLGVPYDRDARIAGKTSFGFAELITLAIDGVTNHSVLPLRLASYSSFLISIVVGILFVFYMTGWLFSTGDFPPGFLTQTLLQLGGIGIICLFIGILGEYISRISRQVKVQPLAIIEERVESVSKSDGESGTKPETSFEVIWYGKR